MVFGEELTDLRIYCIWHLLVTEKVISTQTSPGAREASTRTLYVIITSPAPQRQLIAADQAHDATLSETKNSVIHCTSRNESLGGPMCLDFGQSGRCVDLRFRTTGIYCTEYNI